MENTAFCAISTHQNCLFSRISAVTSLVSLCFSDICDITFLVEHHCGQLSVESEVRLPNLVRLLTSIQKGRTLHTSFGSPTSDSYHFPAAWPLNLSYGPPQPVPWPQNQPTGWNTWKGPKARFGKALPFSFQNLENLAIKNNILLVIFDWEPVQRFNTTPCQEAGTITVCCCFTDFLGEHYQQENCSYVRHRTSFWNMYRNTGKTY